MSSFLDRVRARMTGTLNAPAAKPKPKAVERTRDIVRLNRWDQSTWQRNRSNEVVDRVITDLASGDKYSGGERERYEHAPELAKALWAAMYKAAPDLEDKKLLHRDLYGARAIIEELLDNPRLKELHELTATDAFMSSLALQSMAPAVHDILTRMPPPPPPPSEQPQGQPQDPDAKPKDGEQTEPGGGEPGNQGPSEPGGQGSQPGQPGQPGDQPGNEPGQQEPQAPQPGDDEPGEPGDGEPDDGEPGDGEPGEPGEDEGDGEPGEGDGEPGEDEGDDPEDEPEGDDPDGEPEDANESPEERAEADWRSAFDKLLEGVDIERAVDKALQAANEATNELDNQRRGIGIDDGTWQQMSPEQRLRLAERLNTPEMKALADMVGRMKRFAQGVRATRITDVPHEAYDVEVGNDLRRLLRGEYALLSTPETSYEFYRRYADKELLQFKMRGSEDAGKGPIIACIDKSSSMNGRPMHWALGVAEAMRRFAADDGRDFLALFYSGNHDRLRFEFPKGQADFEKVLTFMSVRASGGTQFDGVLTEALEQATTAFDNDAKGRADIVFITDGHAHLDDDWIKRFNAERERAAVRLFAIQIGGAADLYGRQAGGGVLDKISDAVINVNELRPEAARNVFARI